MLFHKLRDGMACGTKPYTLMTDMLMYPLLELQLSFLLLSEYKQQNTTVGFLEPDT